MHGEPTSPNLHASPGKAALWALVIAAVALVAVVLPAEYGIDWTGAGRVLGLTRMGQEKVAAAKVAGAAVPTAAKVSAEKADTAGSPAQFIAASKGRLRSDAVDVTLAPNAEVEYKAVLAEGEGLAYEWDAGGAAVTFDFHGEPAAGPEGAFLSFEKGSAARRAGTFTAPFSGTHGWYWKNTTAKAVVIKLKVSGFHTELKKL